MTVAGYLTYQTQADVDYYALIGLTKSAPVGEIKRRINMFLTMAHPDNGGSSNALQKILEIKEILLNPVNREIYDQTGLLKKEIQEIAKEFTALLLDLYSQQPETSQADLHTVLNQIFGEQLTQVQTAQKQLANKIKTVEKLISEIETTNLLNKMLFENFEGVKRELEANKLVLNASEKQALAKVILARKISMQTKFRQRVTSVFTTHSSASTANRYSGTSTSNFFR